MIKLTTTGRAPRLYDCFGEKITVKQAADRLGVSVNTLRIRLKEHGDNMEEVFHFYRDREELKMRKNTTEMTAEERAAEELARMLCGGEQEPAPIEAAEATEAVQESTPPEAPQPTEKKRNSDVRSALARVNAAIRALDGLSPEDVGGDLMYGHVMDMGDDLRELRRRKFDCLVDWDAVASAD